MFKKRANTIYIKSTGTTGGTLITDRIGTATKWVITLLPNTYQGTVSGLTDGETYDLANGNLKISFTEGSAKLNGTNYTSGNAISQLGNHKLILTDLIGNSKEINFTIIDTSFPFVTGVSNNEVYNSKSGVKTISFDKGNATLNGSTFLSGSSVNATGRYTFIVTANNTTTVSFAYIKYGDVNGDGLIGILDLAKIKSHLLKSDYLMDVYLLAGDIYQKGNVTITDLLTVKKHILGLVNL